MGWMTRESEFVSEKGQIFPVSTFSHLLSDVEVYPMNAEGIFH
jgi:hypothetical protein